VGLYWHWNAPSVKVHDYWFIPMFNHKEEAIIYTRGAHAWDGMNIQEEGKNTKKK